MTYEVTLKNGFGGPYYVEANDPNEAAYKGLARYRYHCTEVNLCPLKTIVDTVKPCEKTNIQYA